MKPSSIQPEHFRDQLATVDQAGKRIWVYPKKPSGRYHRARVIVAIFLLVTLFGMPFVQVSGHPLMLFNILEGKFILFGAVFTPQDLHLFALAMITLVLFIALFTVVYGRLFCGWVCPQTIFMEMVFRKIEYWIEGDANAQRRLNKSSWTAEKWLKKSGKHLLFFLIAVLIANTFLSYIIGVEAVGQIIREPIQSHLSGFVAMLVFSGLFYGVFAFFREQVCVAVCPYGRMQGVLLDADSVVVAYDDVRGEPRGKLRKNKPLVAIQEAVKASAHQPTASTEEVSPIRIQGDCIDCTLCVQVCPTGIDIRNGTQLECVNCTACIDACDEVMDKIKRPRGLIRYDSETGIRTGRPFQLTQRAKAYSAVLLVLLAVQAFLLFGRNQVETIVLRTPGMLYQEVDEQYYSNLYNFQIINKSTEPLSHLELTTDTPGCRLRMVGDAPATLPPHEMAEGAFFIDFPKNKIGGAKNKIHIIVRSNGKEIDRVKSNFLGPMQ